MCQIRLSHLLVIGAVEPNSPLLNSAVRRKEQAFQPIALFAGFSIQLRLCAVHILRDDKSGGKIFLQLGCKQALLRIDLFLASQKCWRPSKKATRRCLQFPIRNCGRSLYLSARLSLRIIQIESRKTSRRHRYPDSICIDEPCYTQWATKLNRPLLSLFIFIYFFFYLIPMSLDVCVKSQWLVHWNVETSGRKKKNKNRNR